MRTPAQRGRIGNWLRDERLARGWSQKVARSNLNAAGIPVAESVLAEWESGTRVPNERNLALLEGFYGPMTESPATDATPVAGLSELVAELRQLVSVVGSLVEQNGHLQEQLDDARAGRELLSARVDAIARDRVPRRTKVG